jgi:hypothetical protein
MSFNGRILALAVVSLTGTALPFVVSAQEGPSSSQVDALVEDINAHKQLCGKVTDKQSALFHQCANEETSLLARQKELGVSNKDLNSKLQTRGWRWP